MKDLIQYLNALKDKLEIKSINQFSLKLGIPQPTLNKIMKGGMTPSDETCEKIALLAGDQPAIVIALAHKTGAKAGTKKYWEQILKAVTAATFLLLFTLPSFTHASNTLANNTHSVYYVKSLN